MHLKNKLLLDIKKIYFFRINHFSNKVKSSILFYLNWDLVHHIF